MNNVVIIHVTMPSYTDRFAQEMMLSLNKTKENLTEIMFHLLLNEDKIAL